MRHIVLFLILTLLSISLLGDQNIDLSEKILKCEKMQGFGAEGFGLYDIGDNKYKVFDWKFNKKTEIPIRIGEGKAEIKDKVVNAFILKNNIFVCTENDRKISVFDLKGKFIRDFRTDVNTDIIKFNNQRIYIFNPFFFIKDNEKPSEFFRIIDPASNRVLQIINFNEKLHFPKINGEPPSSYGGFFMFDIVDSSNLFVLDPINNAIYHMNQNGNIISKTALPFKTEIKFVNKKYSEKQVFYQQAINIYCSFRVINGEYYVVYEKLDYSSNMASNLDRSFLLKIKQNGTFLKKEYVGMRNILEICNGTLYLFDVGEFFITSVDLKSWK